MKRIFDLVVTFLGLLLLLPVIILTALMVKSTLGSPIFFKQPRPGLNGRIFNMLKFRTMTNECVTDGNLLSNEVRLTKFGRFLRSTSVDELPQLLNVLKGDMSLVGPRPLMIEYLPLYNMCQARRHEVRPGITGWAQINGRNTISWEEKFQLDVWYVENKSFFLDLKILFLTFYNVALRKNIYDSENNIMPPFTGS